ncbi:WXG100 family type VII secretion target [Paenibacillus lautus]|uniref:WXG100 family type VII secretion target n=1 Tax=Paenibacillus lautus TaxID=1401 RepID=UPI001C1128C0|nr:WXG100 family type VII secretion target [Paenibacillus lautus]MBU5348010.1 WXG100 family type VII secretion target [Paenibacillus lautus]
MPRILVPPEVLIRVSEEAARAAEELETTKNRLDQQITYMMSSWEGTTRSRFFEDFQHAHGEMNKTIEHLRIIGQELKAIAFRFISADMHEDLMIAAAAVSGANEPKTFWDHAGDFWQGLQTGAKSVANSVKDTATSLVEDPLDTAKDMAYNMTIGTIEEAADTVVWGGKMIFDADTQDKFAADVEASGGAFNFAGQQAAMAIAGLTTRRFGVKTHPNLKNDSGGDGGTVEGPPKAPIIEELSRAQKRNLETLDNIVDKHLTEMDFSGTLRDLQGNPVPKKDGGYWNHLQEMQDSYKGLSKIKRGLEGSLQNPTLSDSTRKTLQDALNKANLNLKKIEDLFEPFGGLK